MHKHIARAFANSLVQHEERQRENEIIVLDKKRRFVSEPCAQWDMTNPVQHGEQYKPRERDNQRPEEETMFLFALFLAEIGVETDNTAAGAKLCHTDKQSRGINHDARQPDFLSGEETGQHEESSEHSYGYAEVGYYRTTNGLFGNNSHN